MLHIVTGLPFWHKSFLVQNCFISLFMMTYRHFCRSRSLVDNGISIASLASVIYAIMVAQCRR